jgi:hypothetical protein
MMLVDANFGIKEWLLFTLSLEHCLTTLAIGLLQQQKNYGRGAESAILLNSYLKHGWDQLCYLAFVQGVLPPATLPELAAWLHQPSSQWTGFEDLAPVYYDPLLADGFCTPLAQQLGGSFAGSYNPRLELEDAPFRHIYDHCQKSGVARDYAQVREFLNRNPVIDDLYGRLMEAEWDIALNPLISSCYELVPVACQRQHGDETWVALCPHCGWALRWRANEAYCVENGACSIRFGELANDATWIVYKQDMARTKEGIQRYVVAPEITLIHLYDKLRAMWGVRCDLYPGVDAYDLLVRLPNGKRWAVDVKDWHRATELARGLSPFAVVPDWHKAFYVFPTYRADKGYLNTFRNYWQPEPDVTFMRDDEFLAQVKAAIG